MPPKAWHAGRDLGTILRDYLEKLSREENGSHWAFHKTWNAYVSKFDSMRGFKVDTNAERLFSHPFTTKKDAQVHALALLARHSEHENEISTLPKDWQPLVEKRAAEINAGKKPQSVDGAHAGSGEGYRVMTKSGGGTQLLVQFTPPEGFRIDGRLVYKDDLVRDSNKNRDLLAEAHAQNKHVKRRRELPEEPPPSDEVYPQPTNSPPVGSQVLVLWDDVPGPEDGSWRAAVARGADGKLLLDGAAFDPAFGEPFPFDPAQDSWRMAPHVAPRTTPRSPPPRPAPARPMPSPTQQPPAAPRTRRRTRASPRRRAAPRRRRRRRRLTRGPRRRDGRCRLRDGRRRRRRARADEARPSSAARATEPSDAPPPRRRATRRRARRARATRRAAPAPAPRAPPSEDDHRRASRPSRRTRRRRDGARKHAAAGAPRGGAGAGSGGPTRAPPPARRPAPRPAKRPRTAADRRTGPIADHTIINWASAPLTTQRDFEGLYRAHLDDKQCGPTASTYEWVRRAEELQQELFGIFRIPRSFKLVVPCHFQEAPGCIPSCQRRLEALLVRSLRRKDAEGGSLKTIVNEEAFGEPDGEGWDLLDARLDMRLTEEQRPYFRSIWELHFVCGEKTPSVESMVLWPTLLTKYFAGMAHLEGWERYVGGVRKVAMQRSVFDWIAKYSDLQRMGNVPMDTSSS